jgi:hypothetical protein
MLLSALALTLIPSSVFAASASVRFRLPSDPDIDFFRIYVGVQSKAYDMRFDLRQPALGSGGQATAMQDQLSTLLSQPRVFFLAMTSVDLRGQESGFSNEIVIDLRTGDIDADGVLDSNDNCLRAANPDQLDRGGVASPSDLQGTRRDGIGDRCQCGDVDGSGTVTERDAQVIELMGVVGGVMSLAGGSGTPPPTTCNVAGSSACDVTDAQAIRTAVTGGTTLPQVCVAATTAATQPTQPTQPSQPSREMLAAQLATQCPAVARGEITDPGLVQFCDELRRAIVEAVVRALAAQCPGVASGQVRDPVVVQFCQELGRALARR